ncbi:MAG: NAD(P)H-dependent oxidoreductase [Casimicrobiaceae bacterium]
MDRKHKVAVIVGSLSTTSLNRKMANALISAAPASLECSFVEIGDLPHYTPDFEADPPTVVRAFRERIAPFDALLFVTPEYNRSMPGVLKNAIDVGSRPAGKNVWSGKPAAVVTVSPGAIGGFGANHHLRQSLVAVGIATMAQPEAYVGGAKALFDDTGTLVNDTTRAFIAKFMLAFASFIERNRAPL